MGPQIKPDSRSIFSEQIEGLCSQQRSTFHKRVYLLIGKMNFFSAAMLRKWGVRLGGPWNLNLTLRLSLGEVLQRQSFCIRYTFTHSCAHTNTHSRILYYSIAFLIEVLFSDYKSNMYLSYKFSHIEIVLVISFSSWKKKYSPSHPQALGEQDPGLLVGVTHCPQLLHSKWPRRVP